LSDTSQMLALYGEKALFYEVSLAPKPGLVDPFSNGAHSDMDFRTFRRSIESLAPFFKRYAEAGRQHTGSPETLFHKVREIGKQAEADMLAATQNINTHKGANFSFALLISSTGYYLQSHTLPLQAQDSARILRFASEMAAQALAKDWQLIKKKQTLTHGEKLYAEKGINGIRGEAINGYPALSQLLLPFLRRPSSDAAEIKLLRGLILLMGHIEDSNLIHRGGIAAWKNIKKESQLLHAESLPENQFVTYLNQLDQKMIRLNLSPGGAADLLSLGIYFAFLEELLSLPSE